MAAEIGGRPVLRPAGNVSLRPHGLDSPPASRKLSKPPPSPPKPPSKASPPNSQPCTPRFPSPRSPVLKPAPPSSPSKPPVSPSPKKPLHAAIPHSKSSNPSVISKIPAAQLVVAPLHAHCPAFEAVIDASPGCNPRKTAVNSSNAPVPKSPKPAAPQLRKINPHISLTKSAADVFQKDTEKAKGKPNPRRQRSLSLDETSLTNILAAKKAAATELNAQKKLRVAEYGRKKGKASRVAPDVSTALPPASMELKRCKFITAQTDPLYVTYHDEEWGVPVHDDRMLFELLVLAGAQVELSWSTILSKRDAYKVAFSGFDPAAVATFNEKHIQSLEADRNLLLPGGKIRGVVENAQRILEVIEEYGSLDKYLWSFMNHKPIVNGYRYPKQVPVKTSKSESVSKDLVRRGFRSVGPTIIYSFMQAAGMTNDHLLQCFRHTECQNSPSSSPEVTEEKQCPRHECQELSSLPQEVSEENQEQKQCVWHYDCGIFSDVEQELLQLEQQCSDQESKLEECLSREFQSLSALSQEVTQEKQEQKQCVWHYECGIFSLPLEVEQEAPQQEQQDSDQESQVEQEEQLQLLYV